jgi:hypothetical protein
MAPNLAAGAANAGDCMTTGNPPGPETYRFSGVIAFAINSCHLKVLLAIAIFALLTTIKL